MLTYQSAAATYAVTGSPADGAKALAAQKYLQAFLASKIDTATLTALLSQGSDGIVKAGGLYMQTLAQNLATSMQTDLLAKGATRIAVLNIPAIQMTPKFTTVLAQIAQAQGTAASSRPKPCWTAG